MKRSIITTDGNGNITLPTNISATAMSEWELCDLFGVTAPTFRAGLKALCKSGILREYGIRRSIRVSDNCCMEVYNLEAIVALAFHIGHSERNGYAMPFLKTVPAKRENKHLFLAEYQWYIQIRILLVAECLTLFTR